MGSCKNNMKKLFRYFLSAVLVCSALAFCPPVKAQTTLFSDSYITVSSDIAPIQKNKGYQLTVKVVVDGNSMVSNTFKYTSGSSPSITLAAVPGYVVDSTLFFNGSETVPFVNPLQLAYNTNNVLTINMHTETQVTVMQVHADGTPEFFTVCPLRDGSTHDFTLTPLSGEEIRRVDVTPADQGSLVSRNGNTLTVTGKSLLPALRVIVRYGNVLQDTLKIQKSYGGKVNGSDDQNFWLQFDVSGNEQAQTKPIDVILVLDRSGSMGYPYNDSDRLSMLQTALTKSGGFIDSILPKGSLNRIAIVDYSSIGTQQGLCRATDFSGVKDDLVNYVDSLQADGGTQTDAGLNTALKILNNDDSGYKKVVVLFTDGLPGDNDTHRVGEAFSANVQANAIKAAGAELYSISYIPNSTDSEWLEYQEDLYSGSASIDGNKSDDIVTDPASYLYTISQDDNYIQPANADGTPDTSNNIRLPLIRKGYYDYLHDIPYYWAYNNIAFAQSFLQTIATDANHYYDAAGVIPLDNIFHQISTKITLAATNAVITDIIQATNCHLNIDDASSVEWRNTGDANWQDVTTASTDDVYYSVTSAPVNGKGGTIELHFKNIEAAGVQIRFKAAPNDGVYSSDSATEATPDLATNQSAAIVYTDILNQSKTKTSEEGPNYDLGLVTPCIYIPNHVLSITKTIDSPYYDDSALMNAIGTVQSYVFKIEHSNTADFSTIDKTFYEVIRFETTDGNSKTQLDFGLSEGYYRITEDTAWSWKYSQSDCQDSYGTADDGIVWLGSGTKNASITFQNSRKDLGWFGDDAAAVNRTN